MLVWNMETQEWVKLKAWMRWCPDIVTKHLHYDEEDWKNVKNSTTI